MRKLSITLFALAVFFLSVAPTHGQVTAIRFGKLSDGHGGVTTDAVVIVEGERIAGVGAGDAAVPKNSTVIDLRRYVGIPGLIDVHTHMSFYWDRAPGSRPWVQLGTLGAPV